jgi:hypothetical protein
LLDAPPLLASPDGQRFVTTALNALAGIAPSESLADRFTLVRRALRPRDPHFDRNRALGALGDLLKSVLDALPPARRRIFLAGDLAQSIAYNARVLREADADRYRATLASLGDADSVAPGLGALRAQLGGLDPEDWTQSAQLATRAVAALVGSPDAVPFPAAPSIWTILVRSRTPQGRSVPHLALDVVWFDGQHQTYSALPEGEDFGKNADRLTCVRNREPAAGTLHATPLVVPLDHDQNALAASFERSCDAFNAQPPPYVVVGASDDRFIAAMLSAAGLDPRRAMGESSAQVPNAR